MDDSSSTWQLFAAIALIALNAFFVASEFAIVKVRPTRLRELADAGNRKAATALNITQHLDAYLSANQLGITIASIALGWIGEPAVANLLTPLFALFDHSPTAAHAVAGVLGFAIISFFHTVLGELAPKSVSIQKAETVALWCAMPLHAFYIISFPAIWLLNSTANGFLHLFGLHTARDADNSAHSEEEIRMIVSSSQEHGILEEHEAVLVENVLDYTDRVAREIMTPRADVSVLFTDQTLEEATKFVLEEGYTRYPLCREEKDHVVGIIHIRDIFALHCSGEQKTLEEIVREPIIIPETLPLNEVREKFQACGTQIALVVDEYGAFAGIVTLEDLVEEVFGEFRDEFDEQEPEEMTPTADGMEFEAGMLAEEALEALGIDEEKIDLEGVDTIGGLVFSLLGDRPEVGDTVCIDGYQLKVVEVEGLRITRIKATQNDGSTAPTNPTENSRVAAS